jgi:hypothetical protein
MGRRIMNVLTKDEIDWARILVKEPTRKERQKKYHGDKVLFVLVMIAGIFALFQIIIPGIILIVKG